MSTVEVGEPATAPPSETHGDRAADELASTDTAATGDTQTGLKRSKRRNAGTAPPVYDPADEDTRPQFDNSTTLRKQQQETAGGIVEPIDDEDYERMMKGVQVTHVARVAQTGDLWTLH